MGEGEVLGQVILEGRNGFRESLFPLFAKIIPDSVLSDEDPEPQRRHVRQ